MRKVWLSTVVTLALSGYGCSATNAPNQFGVGGSGAGTDSATGAGGDGLAGVGGAGFTTGTGGSSGVTTGGGSDCSEAAKLIYVLSTDNDLYSFDPLQKVFKKIGPLGCQTSLQPNSMAVDRNAVAYVNYVGSDPESGEDISGAIFQVSTADASCQPTAIKLKSGWYRLGMGFSTDTTDGTSEQLFVTGTGDANVSSPGLGRVDFAAKKIVPIGQFTGALSGENAELTGTGDARLFGFFTTSPVEVAQIEKPTGKILSTIKLPGVPTPIAWAFSFWGGDFYLYTATSNGNTSNVNRYRPSDGTTDPEYMKQIGFTIVGAGVSTCAPVAPPK